MLDSNGKWIAIDDQAVDGAECTGQTAPLPFYFEFSSGQNGLDHFRLFYTGQISKLKQNIILSPTGLMRLENIHPSPPPANAVRVGGTTGVPVYIFVLSSRNLALMVSGDGLVAHLSASRLCTEGQPHISGCAYSYSADRDGTQMDSEWIRSLGNDVSDSA
jgi:hypothetical protein